MVINFINAEEKSLEKINEELQKSPTKACVISNVGLDAIQSLAQYLIENSGRKVHTHFSTTEPQAVDVFLVDKNHEINFNGQQITRESKLGKSSSYDFKSIIETSLNEVYIFNTKDYHFEFVNKGGLANLGYSLKEMQEMTPLDIAPQIDAKKFKELIEPLLTGKKQKLVFETVHQRADKSQYPVEVHTQMMLQGDLQFFTAIIVDLTIWKNTHKVASDRLEKMSLLVQNFPDGSISLIDKNLKILFTDGDGYRTHSIDPAKLIGLPAKEILDPRIYSLLENASRQFSKSSTIIYDVPFEDKVYQNTLKPIFDEDKQFKYFILKAFDITELSYKNKAIEIEKNRYSSIYNALNKSALVSITDAKGIIIDVNEEFCLASKYEEYELIGQTHQIINSGYHPKGFWSHMWEKVLSGKNWRAEVKNKAKDGTFYWVDTVINPIIDVHGKITSFLSIRYLITDKKSLEESKEELTDRFALATKAAKMGVWTYDVETKVVFWDEKMLEIYRIKAFDGQFETFANLIHENEREQELKSLFSYIEDEKTFEYAVDCRVNTHNNKEVYVKGKAIIERENGVAKKITGVVWDRTDEKKAELQLKEQNEKLAQLESFIDQSTDAIQVSDESGQLVYVNDAAAKRLSIEKEHVANYHVRDFEPLFKESTTWENHIKELKDKGSITVRSKNFNQITNEPFPVEVKVTLQNINGKHYVIANSRDITDRKESEEKLKASEEQFALALKGSNDGYFDADLKTGKTFYSDRYFEMLGITGLENIQNKDFWRSLVYEADKERVLKEIGDALSNGLPFYEVEERLQHSNGTIIPTLVRAFVTRNDSGEPIRISGTLLDLSKLKKAQEEIKESEEKFRFIAENTSDGIMVFENDRITYSSHAYDTILGYSAEESKQQDREFIYSILHPEDRDPTFKLIDESIKNKETSVTYQFRVKHKKGHYIWREDTANYFYDENGKLEKTILVARDITHRKNDEIALIESEAKYRFFIESSHELICLHEPAGQYKFVSPSITKLTGYEPTELVGKDPYSFFHPDDISSILEETHKPAIAGKSTPNIQYRFKKKDGSYLWLDTYTELIKDEKGNITSLLTGSRDISEIKEADLQTKESEEMLASIANNIPGVIWRYIREADGSDQMDYMSEGAQAIFEVSREEILNNMTPLWEMIHPDDITEFANTVNQSATDLSPWKYEYRIVMPDGRTKWLSAAGNPRELENGTMMWHSIALDITDKREAELKLAQSEEMLSDIANNLPGLILSYVVHSDGTDQILFLSEGCIDLWEISKEDALADTNKVWDKVHPDDLDQYYQSIEKSAAELSTWNFEWRLVMDDGRVKWISGIGQPKELDDGSVLWHTLHLDITDKKKAELELEKTLQHLNVSIETGKMGIWELNFENGHLDWNDQMFSIFGVEKSTFDHNVETFRKAVHPEDIEYMDGVLGELSSTNVLNDTQFRVVKPDGQIRHIMVSGNALSFNEAGKIKKYIGVNIDVTHIAEYQEQLKATVAEKDALFKELHHRIKNNLQMVSSLLFIKSTMTDDMPLKRFIDETSTKIHSVSSIHEQLLQMQGVDQLDVKEYLNSLCRNLIHTYSYGVSKFDLKIELDSAIMDIDRVLNIGLIVNEIISNSMKYAYPETDKGKIYIALKNKNNQSVLTVSDKGIGIPSEKISDMGNSYGMQLISIFTKQIKGTMDIKNSNGTKFTLKFPTNV